MRDIARAPRLWPGARQGVTAVEFGLVAAPALFLLYAIFDVGLFFFMERTLDHATSLAARAIATGAVTTGGLTSAQLQSQYICPALPSSIFSCANIFVQLTTVTPKQTPSGYYAYINTTKSGLTQPPLNSSNDTFNSGGACQYIVLQVLYPQPYFFSKFSGSNSTTFNGSSVSVLMSSTTFKSEPYSGLASSSGC